MDHITDIAICESAWSSFLPVRLHILHLYPPYPIDLLQRPDHLPAQLFCRFPFVQVHFHLRKTSMLFSVRMRRRPFPPPPRPARPAGGNGPPNISDRILCRICETKPPRRLCPALNAEICAPCCGVGREQSISCPLDCEHLREARKHEKLPEIDARSLPHPEIESTDSFLERNQDLAFITGRILLMGALDTEGIVDSDMRDDLDALVRTYKTADSCLVYESSSANTCATAVQQRFQAEVALLSLGD